MQVRASARTRARPSIDGADAQRTDAAAAPRAAGRTLCRPFLWRCWRWRRARPRCGRSIDPSRALWVAVSVLIVTCPCASSLAAPSALVAATGRAWPAVAWCSSASRRSRTLASVDTVFVDKTGTFTQTRNWCCSRCVLQAGRLDEAEIRPRGRPGRLAATSIAVALAVLGQPRARLNRSDRCLTLPGACGESKTVGRRHRRRWRLGSRWSGRARPGR